MEDLLSVMIVDDEVLVRNNITSLINWEKNGYVICAEAEDGASCIKLLEEFRPDIVLIDVYMPVMNGVSLSKYIHDHHNDVKFIILSSYDDYEYVSETFKNGAVDYLLKHEIKPSRLLETLSKARNLILGEKRRKLDEDKQNIRTKAVYGAVTGNLIENLVFNIDLEETLSELQKLDICFNDKPVIVVVMQICNFGILTAKHTPRETRVLVRSVTNFCRQLLRNFDQLTFRYIDQGRFVFFSSTSEENSEYKINSILQQYIGKITDTLNRYMNMKVIFEFSSPCFKPQYIPKGYEEACRMLNGTGHHGTNIDSGLKKNENEIYVLSISREKNILAALEKRDSEAIKQLIDDLFRDMDQRQLGYSSVQLVVNELISILTRAAEESGVYSKDLFTESPICLNADGQKKPCEYSNTAKQELKAYYLKFLDTLRDRMDFGEKSEHVNKVVEFIKANYQKQISLADIAKAASVSPTHLCRIFKEETEMNIMEYLNHVRIEKAKQILKNINSNIKEISYETGYNSYNYFFRVFKQVVGITPHQYRKQIK